MEANGTDHSVADWSKSFYTKSSAFVSGQPLSSRFRVLLGDFRPILEQRRRDASLLAGVGLALAMNTMNWGQTGYTLHDVSCRTGFGAPTFSMINHFERVHLTVYGDGHDETSFRDR